MGCGTIKKLQKMMNGKKRKSSQNFCRNNPLGGPKINILVLIIMCSGPGMAVTIRVLFLPHVYQRNETL